MRQHTAKETPNQMMDRAEAAIQVLLCLPQPRSSINVYDAGAIATGHPNLEYARICMQATEQAAALSLAHHAYKIRKAPVCNRAFLSPISICFFRYMVVYQQRQGGAYTCVSHTMCWVCCLCQLETDKSGDCASPSPHTRRRAPSNSVGPGTPSNSVGPGTPARSESAGNGAGGMGYTPPAPGNGISHES